MLMIDRPVSRTRPAFPSASCFAAVLLIVALSALAVTGCGDRKKEKVSRLGPRDMPYLTGVAVPEGFRLDDQMSEDYETGGVRYARHNYTGSADIHAIRTFYREQMPLLGWNRVSDQQVKERITIRFEKQKEVCTVEIEEGGLGRTKIQIIVKPFHRTPTEPPPRKMP